MAQQITRDRLKTPQSNPMVVWLASGCLLLGFSTGQAQEYDFDVDAQRTDNSLVEIAKTGEVQVLFSPEPVRQHQSPEVRGTQSVDSAIGTSLQDTDLDYEFKSDDFVVVMAANNEPSSPPQTRVASPEPTLLLAQLQDDRTSDDATAQLETTSDSDTDYEEVDFDTIVVTGSRLKHGDASARVDVIADMDIAARGLSTAEDVIRTIPQMHSSINGTNNLDYVGQTAIDEGAGALALGISTANLRGFGSANTLVLLNGRRLAGAAGNEGLYANLRDIPAAAIERVEVHLDGGSSIYGSDAVAGVINIVTKKDFTGGVVSVRNEQSSTGADQTRYSANVGYNWDGGSVSANISHVRSDPYSSRKAGFVTKDYGSSAQCAGLGLDDPSTRPLEGTLACNLYINPFGFMTSGTPYSSGVVSFSRSGFNITGEQLVLPAGNDGRNAQPGDFQRFDFQSLPDIVREDAGGSTDDTSFAVNIEHNFADQLRLRGEFMRTEAKTRFSGTTYGIPAIRVPASNAFNNFVQTDPVTGETTPIDVWVQYNFQTEIDLGLMPGPMQTSDSESDRVLVGFDWLITDNLEFTVDFLDAESSQKNDQLMFALNEHFVFGDPNHAARVAELIASSDPNEAINLFGDGTGQNATIAETFAPIASRRDGTEIKSFEAYLRGSILDMPAGNLGFVVGTELREEAIGDGGASLEDSIGAPGRPSRDLDAYFAELSIPVFSGRNERNGFKSLTFTLQARHDEYTTQGSVEDDPVTGDSIVITRKFSHTSPRVGFNWQVNDTVGIRSSFGEAFRAPTFSDLFAGTDFEFFTPFLTDPLCDCFVPGFFEFGPSPDLRPEFSENLSVGLQLTPSAVDGLILSIDYSEIDFQDRIASSEEMARLLPPDVYGNLAEFFVRDDEGVLERQILRSVNINRRVHRSLDFQASWEIDTSRFGTFIPSIYYHKVLEMYDQAVPEAPKATFVGESVGIDEYSLQGRLEWLKDNMSINMFVDYTPGYINNFFENSLRLIPNWPVESRTTVDLTGTYRWENGLVLRAGGRNIFDTDFPFVLHPSGLPYDSSRVDLRGQVWFADLEFNFDF